MNKNSNLLYEKAPAALLLRAAEATVFESWGMGLLLAYAFASGLSIALSQIFLGSLCLLWINYLSHNPESRKVSKELLYVCTPLFLWLGVAFFASLTGVDPVNSIKEFFKTSLYFCLPFSVFSLLSKQNPEQLIPSITKVILTFAASLSLASFHSVLSSSLGYEIPPKIPGAVTESGQLAVLLPSLLSLALVLDRKLIKSLVPAGSVFFLLLLLSAWPENFYLPASVGPFIAIGGLIAASVYFSKTPSKHEFLVVFFLALLFAGLIINLKRGPWLGVFVGISVLGIFISKKLVNITIALTLAAFLLIGPVRDRALSMVDHFMIGGGRSEIWTLGIELAKRYPLGVGPDNAKIIQKLDPELPELHRHMHNNLLNILVETGWLGLVIFCLWLFRMLKVSVHPWLKKSRDGPLEIILLGIGCSILAWQIAGIVEYNFGDGEVRLIAFCLIGLLLRICSSIKSNVSVNKTKSKAINF